MSEPLRKNDQNSSNTSQDENLILVQVQDGQPVMETDAKAKRQHSLVNTERDTQSSLVREEKEAFQESVMIELEPRELVPAHIDAHIQASVEDG